MAAAAPASGPAASADDAADAADARAEPPRYVAHAGGEVAGTAGSNSRQALDESVRRGHDLIEVDLSWTTDDHLVLFHDWETAPVHLLGAGPGAMSLAEFRAAESNRGLTHITLPELAEWLADHPQVGLVLDVKGRAQEAWARIAERHAELVPRILPQAYDLDEVAQARALGYPRVILTLYASDADDDAVVEFAEDSALFAVTMPVERVRGGLARRLDDAGVFVYAHTVDEYLVASDLMRRGVRGVYTSLLSPEIDARDRRDDAFPAWDARHADPGGPFADRLIPFVPPAGFGLWPSLRLANGSDQLEPVKLIALDGKGEELSRRELQLQPGEETTLPLWLTFGGMPVRALRVSAWREVEVDPRLEMVGRPDVPWEAHDRAHRGFVAEGPTEGLFSHVIVITNPTRWRQVYRLKRVLSVPGERGRTLDDERILLGPGRQALRILPLASVGPLPEGSEISLILHGGPLLVWHVRIDPLMSFVR